MACTMVASCRCNIQITLRQLLSFAAISFLSGCVPVLVAGTYTGGEISTAERGYLIGSIGSTELPGYGSYEIEFRSKDKKILGHIILNARGTAKDPLTQLDWNVSNWKGIAFDVALPPGEYEFSGMHLGCSQCPFQRTSTFSVPFRINSNESLYVGEIKCHVALTPLGPKSDRYVPSGGYLSITDESARDIPVIRMKFRDLEPLPMRIGVPGSTYLGSVPLFPRTIFIAMSPGVERVRSQV
jgi:hypothetical protein